MVGVIAADVRMHERPQGRGYVRLVETGEHPWGGVAPGSRTISAHEFHYSGLENLSGDFRYAYRVERGHGVDGVCDGIVYKNLLASYTHMRDASQNPWVKRFLAHVRRCREQDKRPA
jgi:cobyrinic acid a,c-diamide synthase